MNEHDQNLHDLVAMFAITGLLMRGREDSSVVKTALEIANDYMNERKPDGGLATIKKRKKDVPQS